MQDFLQCGISTFTQVKDLSTHSTSEFCNIKATSQKVIVNVFIIAAIIIYESVILFCTVPLINVCVCELLSLY